jgi:hypothetical protein
MMYGAEAMTAPSFALVLRKLRRVRGEKEGKESGMVAYPVVRRVAAHNPEIN